MRKYEIKRDTFEFRFGTYKDSIPSMTSKEVFDYYLSGEANDAEIIGRYDTESDALDAFSDDYGTTWAEKGNTFWLLRGSVEFVEINEYDEDGEFDNGGDIVAYSAEGYDGELD